MGSEPSNAAIRKAQPRRVKAYDMVADTKRLIAQTLVILCSEGRRRSPQAGQVNPLDCHSGTWSGCINWPQDGHFLKNLDFIDCSTE